MSVGHLIEIKGLHSPVSYLPTIALAKERRLQGRQVEMGVARKKDAQSLEQRSKKLHGSLLDLALAMAGTSILLCSLVGGVIHLYPTFLAFQASGYVAALLTFALPFLAEIYWIVIIWSHTGNFWHGLTIASIAYFILCVMTIAAAGVAASKSDQGG